MNSNPIEIPNEIRMYLESLLQDANMTTLDETMREEMIKELFVRLDNFITTTIIETLPPEHLDAFIKLNEEKKSQAEIEQYLKDVMPNTQEVFTKAFAEFRDLYLGNVAATRNAPIPPPPAPVQENGTSPVNEADKTQPGVSNNTEVTQKTPEAASQAN